MNKFFPLLFCLLLMFPGKAVLAADSLFIDSVLVSVDGKPITLQDFRARVSPRQVSDPAEINTDPELQYALDLLILERLVEEEAAKRRLSVSESEAERYMSEITMRNNLTREQFEEALTQEGKTLEQYRQQIRYDILRTKLSSSLMKSAPAVSDTDIDNYIESNPELSKEGSKVKLSQIFISKEGKSEEKLQEILTMIEKDLDSGKKFSEVARQYSESIEGAAGGDLGVMAEEDLNPMITEAIQNIDAGEHTNIITSAAGLHIFQVEERFLNSEDEDEDEIKKSLHTEVRQLLEKEKAQQWLQTFYSKDIFDLHSVDKKIANRNL